MTIEQDKTKLLEEISIEEDIIAKLPSYKETNDRACGKRGLNIKQIVWKN